MMRVLLLSAFILSLSGCAVVRPLQTSSFCSPEEAARLGQSDGTEGKIQESLFSRCVEKEKNQLLSIYRSAYENARPRKLVEKDISTALRVPASKKWLCELEASRRVFTGGGESKDKASEVARTACGSHLEASSCNNQADCRQEM